MNTPDDWGELTEIWREQEVPDLEDLSRRVKRGTFWIKLARAGDYLTTVLAVIFSGFLIQTAPGLATYAVAACLLGLVGYALYWSIGWRRGLLEVERNDQRSLLEMQALRSRRMIRAIRFNTLLLGIAAILGGLSSYLTDPAPQPFLQFLIPFSIACAALWLIALAVGRYFLRKQQLRLAEWEAMLEMLDEGN